MNPRNEPNPQYFQPTPVSGGASGFRDTAQRNKFVGSRNSNNKDCGTTGEHTLPRNNVFLPPDIRRAAQMLGLQAHDITTESVHRAWRTLICAPGAHPDSGGPKEGAILLNTSRDTLLRWLEESAPRLGRQFPIQQK